MALNIYVTISETVKNAYFPKYFTYVFIILNYFNICLLVIVKIVYKVSNQP